MAADCGGLQAQVGAIIEILANSAVAEICKLVEDGYAALRSQMDREREKSEQENDSLRQTLREINVKMWSYERKMRRRSQRGEMHEDHFRPTEGKYTEDRRTTAAARQTQRCCSGLQLVRLIGPYEQIQVNEGPAVFQDKKHLNRCKTFRLSRQDVYEVDALTE